MRFTLIIILALLWLSSPNNFSVAQPTWITSTYFRAGYQQVITTLTGNTSLPTYTFTFSSPCNGTPSLAYGIKNYRGKKFDIKEMTILVSSIIKYERQVSLRALLVWRYKFSASLIFGF